ncbi:MAG: LPS export ABC transporter periplasmic protein LptC [Bacteroidetes bacterium]|nr:LPS export ABC transporter periplasmic protein LptC [Bacteroidota bacterium]
MIRLKLLVVLLVCVLLSLFFGCEDKVKPSVLTDISGEELPQQESWNSTITVVDSGRVKAIIQAGYLRYFEETSQTELNGGVLVRFYGFTGKQTSYLISEEAVIDENTNDMEARGNVLVVSSDSSRLRTERLFWDNKRQLIYTPNFVTITTSKERLQGHGFEADQSLRYYKIFRVTGQATMK